ncbi:hypothetical protein ColTof3_00766 [Colletotrichum tofieldiae]|nr:hypothetical protein ColTof3_00766 [Colletotrichum tofieldiae]
MVVHGPNNGGDSSWPKGDEEQPKKDGALSGDVEWNTAEIQKGRRTSQRSNGKEEQAVQVGKS